MRINTAPIPCSKTLTTRKHQHINSVSTVKCFIIFQKIKPRYFGWFPNVFNFYGDSFNMFFYQLLVDFPKMRNPAKASTPSLGY